MSKTPQERRGNVPSNRGSRAQRISTIQTRASSRALRASAQYQDSQDTVPLEEATELRDPQRLAIIAETDQPKDSPQESTDSVQERASTSGVPQVTQLEARQDNTTMSAASGSSATTTEHVTYAEEASSDMSENVQLHGQRLGKRVQTKRAPESAPATAPKKHKLSNPSQTSILNKSPERSAVSYQSCRDTVIHLLALKNYKNTELLVQVQKDDISQLDKNTLETILLQVASLNPEDNSYSLKDSVYEEIREDWPGYTEEEKQLLKVILSEKLETLRLTTSTRSSERGETSEKDTPLLHNIQPLNLDISPLQTTEQAISHLPSQVTSSDGDHLSSDAPPPPGAAHAPVQLFPTLPAASDQPETSTSSFPSTPEDSGPQDLAGQSKVAVDEKCQRRASRSPFRRVVPGKSPHLRSLLLKQRSKIRMLVKCQRTMEDNRNTKMEDEHRENKEAVNPETSDIPIRSSAEGDSYASMEPDPSIGEQPDYMQKYFTIVSREQRQNYKDDFNAEYNKYRSFHRQLDDVTVKFVELDKQRQLLAPESEEYKSLEDKIEEEYAKLRESHPDYFTAKYKYRYLHGKLSYIKNLIQEFDRRQLESQL